ncbi:MAG: hypothetical protein GWP03_00830 [Proteobacteria bacterium]|nr:hypothetical protein [Pseudomonadota bacterium]
MKTFIAVVFQEIKSINRKKRIIIQFILFLIFAILCLFGAKGKMGPSFSFSLYSLLFFTISIFLYIDIDWSFFHINGGVRFYRSFPISLSKIKFAHFTSVLIINLLFLLLFASVISIAKNVNLIPNILYVSVYILLLTEISTILGTFKSLHFGFLGMPAILLLSIFRSNTYPVIQILIPPLDKIGFGWSRTVDLLSVLIYQLIFFLLVFKYEQNSSG